MTHENDYQGEHGSHVAGIASANAYIPAGDGTYSKALDIQAGCPVQLVCFAHGSVSLLCGGISDRYSITSWNEAKQ